MPPRKNKAPTPSDPDDDDDDERNEGESENEMSDQSDDVDGSSDGDSNDGSEEEEGSNDSDNDSNDDNEDDEEDEEEEVEDTNPKKRARQSKKTEPKVTKATKVAASKKKKVTKSKAAKSSKKSVKVKVKSEVKISKIKSLKKSDRIEEARKAYKWWEAPKLSKGINWQYLEHPGVAFPPSYVPHNIPLLYDGKEVRLTPDQEEVATFYAAMPEDGPQLGNPKTKKVFQQNFFDDFKEVLGPSHVIKSFEKCDFSLIKEHLALQKNLKKVATDEEKQLKKDEKEKAVLKYGYALIDGRIEKVIFLLFFFFFL
jgi:DNA topoisomerase-1